MRAGNVRAQSGQIRIDPRERIALPLGEHHLAVVLPPSQQSVRRDLRAVLDRPSQRLESGKGGVFDGGFGEPRHTFVDPSSSPERATVLTARTSSSGI